jgi:Uncharacterised protein family (UPF0158)
MAVTVSLRDVMDALESASHDSACYLDPDTGEIIRITEDAQYLAEEQSEQDWTELPPWQQQELPRVRAVLQNRRALVLPSRFEIDEWSIMQRFALEQADQSVRRELLYAIHGTGAFRAFKVALRLQGIADHWYKFRKQALRQIARQWLDEHHLRYQ